MTKSTVLRAAVSKGDDDTIVVAWQVQEDGGDVFDDYEVSRSQLDNASKAVRAVLEDYPAALGKGDEELAKTLHTLAKQGQELFNALVSPAPSASSATRAAANTFRDWFEANVRGSPEGKWRIEILTTDTSNVYPLGFAFTPPEGWSPGEKDVSYDTYSAFWSCSFQLCTYHIERHAPRQTDLDLLSKSVSLYVEKYDDSFRKYTEEYKTNEAKTDKLYLTREQMIGGAETYYDWHHIMYVLLRHDGKEPRLTAIPRTLHEHSLRFVLLDGDAVIRGDRGKNWPEAMLKGAWDGVIAIETDLPNHDNGFPGWDFLKAAVGAPLMESLLRVRRETWPAGLMYGIYCPLVAWAVAPVELGELEHLDTILAEVQRKR